MNDIQRFVKNSKVRLLKLRIRQPNSVVNDNELSSAYLFDIAFHRAEINFESIPEQGVKYMRASLCLFDDSQNYTKQKISCEYALSVKNVKKGNWHTWKGHHDFERNTPFYTNIHMRTDTLRDPDSEFLNEEGRIAIQVEIRCIMFTDKWKNRACNFYDWFPDDQVKLRFPKRNRSLFAQKRMLIFHSPVFAKQLASSETVFVVEESWSFVAFEMLLQLIHGFNAQHTQYCSQYWLDIIHLAHVYRVSSVIRQCQAWLPGFNDDDIYSAFNRFNCHQPSDLLIDKLERSNRCRRQLKTIEKLKREWSDFDDVKKCREVLKAIARLPLDSTQAVEPEPVTRVADTDPDVGSKPYGLFAQFTRVSKRMKRFL